MANAGTDPLQLEAARALAPEISARAADSEAARRLAPELAAKLAAAGLFSICVPARYGGGELSARDVLRVIEAVARADGAAGWCVMIGATTGVLAASLPEPFAREIYAANPRVVTGGAAAPIGRARAVAGGHQVSGRWSFGSGCQHSDWLVGGTVMDTPGEARLMFFARDQVQIHDTWYTGGLRGSGSHDFEVADAFVPEGRSVRLGSRPLCDGPLYRFPVFGLLALGVCAVALGIARRALDELVELAVEEGPDRQRAQPGQPLGGAATGRRGRSRAALRARVRLRRDRLGVADRLRGSVTPARHARRPPARRGERGVEQPRAPSISRTTRPAAPRSTTRARSRAASATSTSPPNT